MEAPPPEEEREANVRQFVVFEKKHPRPPGKLRLDGLRWFIDRGRENSRAGIESDRRATPKQQDGEKSGE
jgi:hypothetical protein